MIRWSAHLGTLFTEVPLIERFAAASEAGFVRTECWSPFDEDLGDFADAVRSAGAELVSFNLAAGDMPAGERGFLNRREQRDEVVANARDALDLAGELKVPCINCLVGNSTGEPHVDQLEAVEDALSEIASMADDSEVILLVEALNPDENPDYLLPNLDEAAELVARVGRPGVRLLFDAYHAARADREVTADFTRHRDRIAHIQIADSPGRHEPGTGSTDLRSLLETVTRSSYEGAVGLEYVPSGGTTESLAWLPRGERMESKSFPETVGGSG